MSENSDIGGMTVNERLNHFGLVSEFDAAIRARNKDAAITVLTKAGFSPQQAQYTAARVLKAPERYGY